MQLIDTITELKLKEVDYHGIKLTIMEGYKYIATDKDGHTWAYLFKPTECKHFCGVFDSRHDDDPMLLCTVDLEEMNWRDTLMEVNYENNQTN